MSHILVLGGGFGGVVAAERLVESMGHEHHTGRLSMLKREVLGWPLPLERGCHD